MERTNVTYRGKTLFTLGHTGTFITYIFIFLLGCGWLWIGIDSIIEGWGTLYAIMGCVFGLGSMTIAFIAMYENRKEVIDAKKLQEEKKRINVLLERRKDQYQKYLKENHVLKQYSEEKEYIVDKYAWDLLNDILIFSKCYTDKQLDLIRLIYDGIGLDSYYFDFDNHLINDKFYREQIVITTKTTKMVPANTILIVKSKERTPSFLQNLSDKYQIEQPIQYFCTIKDTGKFALIDETDIMDYNEWLENNS